MKTRKLIPPTVDAATVHRSNSPPKHALEALVGGFPATRAFSLTDLLVVLAVLGVLAALGSVAASSPKDRSAAAICLNNLRQLANAWILYAESNNQKLVPNSDGGNNDPSRNWANGWLDLSSTQNTNVQYLKNALLGPYVSGGIGVYKCPADHSTAIIGGKTYARVRSVSMQCYMGFNYSRMSTSSASNPYTSGYRQFYKATDIITPSPAQAMVFLDEREDSINDCVFQIEMAGYDPLSPNAQVMVDFPADYHDGGANFSFADGHVENWHWRDPRTTPVHRRGQLLALGISTPKNPDVARIQAAATRKISNPMR